MQYVVYYLESEIAESLGTCYNIKHDFKKNGIKYNEENKLKISQEIVSEIQKGIGRKSCVCLYYLVIDQKRKLKLYLLKIRFGIDEKSKRDAYRSLVLCDEQNGICIILHIYAKNKKENITKKEECEFKNIVEEYILNIKEGEN